MAVIESKFISSKIYLTLKIGRKEIEEALMSKKKKENAEGENL